jgi:serine/threonine protein kinase
MAATDAIELGTVVAGRYRVEERLGEGGMGSVYRVEHVHTGQQLALKVLNPKLVENAVALERFRREARAPARIESDHVVKVTDADVAVELGGAPFLVMDLLRGETFEQLLTRRGILPVAEALTYLRQIARALDKAHALDIVHRDIKPENLFLTQRDDGTPCVKLLDFGIAKHGAVEGVISKTATGEIIGTPLYMSPEQTLGKTHRISPQTDVWALGVIAYKFLMGSEPWTAETLPHLVAQIAYEPVPVPSQRGCPFGPEFDTWFSRCCAREASERYASASEAIDTLSQALGIADADHTSQSSLPAVAASSGRRVSGPTAFAETAPTVAASGLMSDTLAAQVATHKRPPQLVYLAAIGGAIAVGASISLWLVMRSRAPTLVMQPDPAAAVITASAPLEMPVLTPPNPVVAPTLATSAPEPQPETTAPKASTQPTARPVSARRSKPSPSSAPATVVTPAPTAAPASIPSPTRDPLSGRH